jgi:hypothetical protein
MAHLCQHADALSPACHGAVTSSCDQMLAKSVKTGRGLACAGAVLAALSEGFACDLVWGVVCGLAAWAMVVCSEMIPAALRGSRDGFLSVLDT